MEFKSPEMIGKMVAKAGIKKANLTPVNLLLLGFLAGAFIAFGGLLAIMVTAGISAEIWGSMTKFVFAGLFPLGLILVIIAGAELATGNMMTQPMALLNGNIKVTGLLRNWFLVYIGNFIGSIFVAYFLVYLTGLVSAEPWTSFVVNTANAKISLSWTQAFWRGVGCNWLVGLAIWMSLATDNVSGKIFAIWWPIMGFVAIGFEHSIANTFFIPLGILTGSAPGYLGPMLEAGWSSFVFNNLIPVTLGNIIGAGLFVSLIYWFTYLKRSEKEQQGLYTKKAFDN